MNILILCNKSPFPPGEGGPMAINSIVTGLIEAGHQVKVMAFNSEKYHVDLKDIPAEYKRKTRIEFIDVNLRINKIKAFKNLFTDESYHVQRFISRAFEKRLVKVLEEEEFDIVQLEMIYMAPYIETIRTHSNAKIVLRTHNVEHQIWERMAEKEIFMLKKFYLKHLARTLKKYELSVIDKVDGIAAITYTDAAFFRGITATPVIDIPYGIDLDKFMPNYETNKKPTFYHIGSMNWRPNEEAMRWFLTEIWDEINERVPNARLYLAGRNMPKWLRKLKKKGVSVVGEVPDAQEFVKQHDVAVVPLLSGSGIRIKIIESMALGKAVITTIVGAEGIQYTEYEDIIIAENVPKMVEAVCMLYNHPEEAELIGRKARKLVEELYDNKKIINRLQIFYDEIISKKVITELKNVEENAVVKGETTDRDGSPEIDLK